MGRALSELCDIFASFEVKGFARKERKEDRVHVL